MVYVITLLAAMQLPVAYTCAATPQVTTPTPTRPPTPAPVPPPTPIPPVCCQPLLVTPTNNINLANGIMSFTYNSNTCRALAIATCSQPTVTPPLQLMAGVTANQVNFINFQPTTVSVPLICNSAKQWQIGEPPLIISTIECVLSTL
ncbi:Adipocyte enhancer-binding protein [Dirofilaria immitis]